MTGGHSAPVDSSQCCGPKCGNRSTIHLKYIYFLSIQKNIMWYSFKRSVTTHSSSTHHADQRMFGSPYNVLICHMKTNLCSWIHTLLTRNSSSNKNNSSSVRNSNRDGNSN